MRILVTGATGFIGSSLVPALARQGHFVRAAARDPSRLVAGPNIEPVPMLDLSTAVNWAETLDGITHIVHLAGIAHAPGALPDVSADLQSVLSEAVDIYEQLAAHRLTS